MSEKYQPKKYIITLADGTEHEAIHIHLNPRFHTYTKDLDRWRIEGNKYLTRDEIKSIREA